MELVFVFLAGAVGAGERQLILLLGRDADAHALLRALGAEVELLGVEEDAQQVARGLRDRDLRLHAPGLEDEAAAQRALRAVGVVRQLLHAEAKLRSALRTLRRPSRAPRSVGRALRVVVADVLLEVVVALYGQLPALAQLPVVVRSHRQRLGRAVAVELLFALAQAQGVDAVGNDVADLLALVPIHDLGRELRILVPQRIILRIFPVARHRRDVDHVGVVAPQVDAALGRGLELTAAVVLAYLGEVYAVVGRLGRGAAILAAHDDARRIVEIQTVVLGLGNVALARQAATVRRIGIHGTGRRRQLPGVESIAERSGIVVGGVEVAQGNVRHLPRTRVDIALAGSADAARGRTVDAHGLKLEVRSLAPVVETLRLHVVEREMTLFVLVEIHAHVHARHGPRHPDRPGERRPGTQRERPALAPHGEAAEFLRRGNGPLALRVEGQPEARLRQRVLDASALLIDRAGSEHRPPRPILRIGIAALRLQLVERQTRDEARAERAVRIARGKGDVDVVGRGTVSVLRNLRFADILRLGRGHAHELPVVLVVFGVEQHVKLPGLEKGLLRHLRGIGPGRRDARNHETKRRVVARRRRIGSEVSGIREVPGAASGKCRGEEAGGRSRRAHGTAPQTRPEAASRGPMTAGCPVA